MGGERGRAAGGVQRLRPSGFFALRVPALPMATLTEWARGVEAPTAAPEDLPGALERDRELLRERLEAVVARPEVQGALSVASPDVLDAARERVGDPGVQAALVRYVTRMSSRPTPYGLFAACGVGLIADRTRIALPEPASWCRHTRLDADYLDALIRELAGPLRPELSFRPNDSLHLMGGRWRYVEGRLDGFERSYHLVEVADSKPLQRALHAARDGARLADIADAVAAGELDRERAARYAEQLVDAQVLMPTVAVTITGRLPLDALLTDLEPLGAGPTVAVLEAVREELTAIDAEGAAVAPERHERIAARLRELPAPVERSRLLQVDMTIPSPEVTLAQAVADDVVRAVELLRRMASRRPPTELDAFRDAFRERYELREIPLLEALDEELGVGLGGASQHADPAPLLEGLRLPARPRGDTTFGPRERRLLELMHRAWSAGAREVSLTSDDIVALEQTDPLPLPAAMSATAVLARTKEGDRVLIAGATGPSGARLLGRFCHADPQLDSHVRSHLRDEEALDPEAVHAEIVHLPSGRLVNVLARPVLRRYEIEWLGRSGAPPDRRLPASDLLLSLRDSRFVLRSRALGRRVVPRLTSAHNYSRRSPGVYRFLAAIQAEGTVEGLGWSWLPFGRAPFTPRVRWGRIVLCRARWWAAAPELRELDQRDAVARWRAVQAWRGRRRLPRWVCLVDADNVLAFDMDNVLSVDTFVRAVRRRQDALLEELLPGPDELVAEAPDGHRALELVVPLVRAAPVPVAGGAVMPPETAAGPTTVRRKFPPGSEWTYLKLYTGSATADRLLRDSIAPRARELIGSGAADCWFFLRYSDAGFHLRVRAHGEADGIRPAFEALAERAIDEGLAHDALLGTYTREVERYGGPEAILLAERLFHADSEAVADLLGMFQPGHVGFDARWRIGVLGADALMRDLGLDAAARASQSRRMREAFEREFGADTHLRKGVADKVRAERQALDDLLDAGHDSGHRLAPGIRVIAERSERVAPLVTDLAALRAAGRLQLPVEALAVPFVHMWVNRLCRSESRLQEYVTYALLARLHEARLARARSQS